jgi:hypothetical protein
MSNQLRSLQHVEITDWEMEVYLRGWIDSSCQRLMEKKDRCRS